MSIYNKTDIIHLGAEHSVTGSCHLVRMRGLNLMIDCGLVQGGNGQLPMEKWPIKPSDIDFLFLTHAHTDHIGRVPELIQNGFRGEIITTHPTKALLEPMLRDTMAIGAAPAKEIDKTRRIIDELSWGFEYDECFDLKKGVTFTLRRAGHILGSCFIHLAVPGWSVIFSGDLGVKNAPILPDPAPPSPCDLLILESTYGDRIHEKSQDRIQALGRILTRALSDGGKIYIPAFALGRTQTILYELDRLRTDPQYRTAFPSLDATIPVFVDSPLALELTKIYVNLAQYWDAEASTLQAKGDHPIDFSRLYAVGNHKDHELLLSIEGPAIIIAGSGMCSGGRIVDHLKNGLRQSKNDVVFVGYPAQSTPGRAILDHGNKPGGYAYLDGEQIPIEAAIHVLSGYSAHADQAELIAWVDAMPEKPAAIKLVHGEPAAQKALSTALENHGYHVDL